jgi:hypothetical protein
VRVMILAQTCVSVSIQINVHNQRVYKRDAFVFVIPQSGTCTRRK